MPLARIFTHHPERTAALASQLREQGYTVEVASPDQSNLPPADLEVEFEICERADVLERAAGLADELQADVAVAPGVMESAAESRADAKVPASAEPESRRTAALTANDPEREFEAAFAASDTASEPEERQVPVIEIPVMERAPLPPVAFFDDSPVKTGPALQESARPADPVPYLAQLTPFGTPSGDESHHAALRLENSPTREAIRQTSPMASNPKRPGAWQRITALAARTVASSRAIGESTAESFREYAQEYRKKAQVRSAEARAAHEARLLDLEQRRAEAQQRAAELEAAREAAAARLIQLVRERDPGLKEEALQEQMLHEQILREHDRAVTAGPAEGPSILARVRHSFIALLQKRNSMTPQLRAVLTGAAAVTVLFVVGIVLGSVYPRAPLARPSGQAPAGVTVQTGGVTVQGGGVTVKAGGSPTQTASPAQPTTTVASSRPAASPEKPSPRTSQAQRIAAQQGESSIGDDVVIRHFSRPAPTQKPRQSGQQAGLKHFSDLEN